MVLSENKDILNQNRDSKVGGKAPVAPAGGEKSQPVDGYKSSGHASGDLVSVVMGVSFICISASRRLAMQSAPRPVLGDLD